MKKASIYDDRTEQSFTCLHCQRIFRGWKFSDGICKSKGLMNRLIQSQRISLGVRCIKEYEDTGLVDLPHIDLLSSLLSPSDDESTSTPPPTVETCDFGSPFSSNGTPSSSPSNKRPRLGRDPIDNALYCSMIQKKSNRLDQSSRFSNEIATKTFSKPFS